MYYGEDFLYYGEDFLYYGEEFLYYGEDLLYYGEYFERTRMTFSALYFLESVSRTMYT